jgi:hypothetical protein
MNKEQEIAVALIYHEYYVSCLEDVDAVSRPGTAFVSRQLCAEMLEDMFSCNAVAEAKMASQLRDLLKCIEVEICDDGMVIKGRQRTCRYNRICKSDIMVDFVRGVQEMRDCMCKMRPYRMYVYVPGRGRYVTGRFRYRGARVNVMSGFQGYPTEQIDEVRDRVRREISTKAEYVSQHLDRKQLREFEFERDF